MARCIYKPNPDRDEYVIWSTVVDCFISEVMTKEEALEEWPHPDSFDRADETGASWADWRCKFWGTQKSIREISIGDESFDGEYMFGDLPDIITAAKSGDIDTLRKLITPHEDDDPHDDEDEEFWVEATDE